MKWLEAFVPAAKDLRVIGVTVSQGDEREEYHFEEEIRRNLYSATKSFTSAAVGLAVSEGLFSLDDRVADCFREEMPQHPSDFLAALTVRDLLTMRLGQAEGFLMGPQRLKIPETDWVYPALRRPFVSPPGERFVYNNVGPYLAGILVQKRADCDLVDYLMPRLFEPLGIRRPTWECDPLGRSFGAGGLFLSVSELEAFARLYLKKGRLNGRQLLPEEWVAESTAKYLPPNAADAGLVGEGYGYLFWRGEHGSYRADGKYGQFGIVLPDKEAVIAVSAESREPGKLLSLIFETIYPKL